MIRGTRKVEYTDNRSLLTFIWDAEISDELFRDRNIVLRLVQNYIQFENECKFCNYRVKLTLYSCNGLRYIIVNNLA